jgi:hypothetical protein
MHRAAVALVALALVGGLGCSAAPPPAAPSTVAAPERWGTTTIHLRNRLAWPYELASVLVAVDGVPVYSRSADGERLDRDLEVGTLELSPGDHTVQATVVASYRSAPLGGQRGCKVRLQAAESLHVSWQAVDVALDLHLGGVTRGFAERAKLVMTVQGATRLTSGAVQHRRYDVTVPPQSPDRILAGVEARIERAREQGDVIQLLCYSSKLAELRTLSALLDRRRHDASQGERDPIRAVHDQGLIDLLGRKMAQVWATTSECSAADGYAVEMLTGLEHGAGGERDDVASCAGDGGWLEEPIAYARTP